MKAETDIARRIYYTSSTNETARPAVRVAMAGISIGVMVMILTICIVVGFKHTVSQKVAGFGAHIQIVSFDNNNTYEYQPIRMSEQMLQSLRSLPHVVSVNTFSTKPGMLKTHDAYQGIVLKGLPHDSIESAWTFFEANKVAGTLPSQPNEILLSAENARLLQVGVGDRLLCYFVGESLKVRRFTIVGIYDTSFADYDKLFVICQQTDLVRLNDWDEDEISGVELRLDNLRYLDEVYDNVYFTVANRLDDEGNAYYPQSLMQMNPAIFYWLDLLDMNVWVIIILMLAVSGFNVVSGLIIMILDAIPMIGILKALGADNAFIRRIFMHEAGELIGRGMLIGNAVGLLLATMQYYLHLIPLDAATYYVSYVPIAFPWGWIIALNVLILAVSMLALLGPCAMATRISPARVMHFE